MEVYLRAFTTYLQDNWVKWLPLAKFAANNTESKTLGCSPFFANYRYNPPIGFKPQTSLPIMPPAELNAHELATRMEDLLNYLKEEMAAAQAKYEDDANPRRKPAPVFKEGDKVWLDA